MATIRSAMKNQDTATIGRLVSGDVSFPLVLKWFPRTGSIVPYIRDGKKLEAVGGKFLDNAEFSHLVGYIEDCVLAEGARLELEAA